MVRVIAIHNFLKQDICSLDDLIDVVAVPPDILLIIQPDHVISVRNSCLVNDPGYIIPTVDQVIKIIHSVQGNYIGALEKKLTRDNIEVFYVRIYLNWESLRKYKDLPPMTARIAGRVTPLSQNQEGLEMIEIPAHNMPDNIACCAISGNLLLSSKNILSIYKLKIQAHDISKIYFIDFEQVPFDFLLSFIPARMQFVENMVAVQNDEILHVFKIQLKVLTYDAENEDKEASNDDFENLLSNMLAAGKENKAIVYEKLIKQNQEMQYRQLQERSEEYSKIDKLNTCNRARQFSCELEKINTLSFPLLHDFPTVLMSKSIASNGTCNRKQKPFAIAGDLNVTIIGTSPTESYKLGLNIENILQHQLTPLILGSTTNREIHEKFSCLILKPFYSNDMKLMKSKQRYLESEHFRKLKTIACFFGIQQEGYLYCFDYINPNLEGSLDKYTVYPFTAPIIDVKLEDSLLHALTETGLETYTMRAAQHLMKNNEVMASPSCDDPVCLIGLRPFVNVLKLSITHHYLILFANNEESRSGIWTLYKLNLSDPASMWQDFLTVSEENKWEAPATYIHLIGEGHLILKTYLDNVKWISKANDSENHLVSAACVVDEKEKNLAQKFYKESCALLGDFHMLNEDYLKSSNYYRMSDSKILENIRRVESLYSRIPDKFKNNYNEKGIMKGLIFYIKKTLTFYDEKYSSFSGNKEEFYSPEIGSMVNILLDFLEKENSSSISDLILDSAVLREFSTDRVLKIMKQLLSKRSPPQEKDALSLALMCIQRGQSDQAKTVLLTINSKHLEEILLQYYHLLFEVHGCEKMKSFSELSLVLIETYPTVIGRVLSYLVIEKSVLNLSRLLTIFLDFLPTGIVLSKNSSIVLQNVLENYFKTYFERPGSRDNYAKLTEALKILIRIYLIFLKQKMRLAKENADIEKQHEGNLFSKSRPNYLNRLPPFGPDFSELLSPKHEISHDSDLQKDLKCVLFKIQDLLSLENLPPECLTEVRNYLTKQTNIYGYLSLQTLSARSVQEGVQLLMNFAPQAVIEYVKEFVREFDDWKFTVNQLQIKILASDDSCRKFYYQQILSDILHHAAKNVEIEDLMEILPQDMPDAEKYLRIAQNNAQADHIKTLIMTTGRQLRSTLYENLPDRKNHIND